jgi:AcrR family transcriptional regulator
MEVKERIIEAASELFGKQGVRSVTMDDLAKHLGISKRTIYENFNDKETILIACLDDYYEKNGNFVKKTFNDSNNVAEAILFMLRKDAEQASKTHQNIMEDIRKYFPKVFKGLLHRYNTEKGTWFENLIKRGINEGVFLENLNPSILVHFFNLQTDYITHNDVLMNKFTISEIFENIAMTFLRGICTDKGIKIIDKYREKL